MNPGHAAQNRSWASRMAAMSAPAETFAARASSSSSRRSTVSDGHIANVTRSMSRVPGPNPTATAATSNSNE